MFNDFLSSLLQIVIVLDLVGLVAYFVLAAVRPRRLRTEAVPELAPPPAATAAGWRGWTARVGLEGLGSRLSELWRRPGSRPATSPADSLEAAFGRLRRVLNSYQEGLA